MLGLRRHYRSRCCLSRFCSGWEEVVRQRSKDRNISISRTRWKVKRI